MALLDDYEAAPTRGSVDPHDVTVGGNVKKRRAICGLSQTDLADRLSISYQQVQKFEHGKNRIGAGRLYRIAKILNCDVSIFFDGIEDLDVAVNTPQFKRTKRMTAFSNTPQGVHLIDAVSNLPADLRKQIVSLAKAIAGSQPSGD